MEEQRENIIKQDQNDIEVKKESNKKFLISLGLGTMAIFCAAFLAFWLVFSSIAKNVNITYSTSINDFNNKLMKADLFPNDDFFKRIDKQFDELRKEAQRMQSENLFSLNMNSPTVKTENLNNEYRITVNLKAFGSDEKNVNLKVNGNRVTLSAKYEDKENKDSYNSSSFYQSFSLPGKIDQSKIKREKSGDILTIIIPKINTDPQKPVKNIPADIEGQSII